MAEDKREPTRALDKASRVMDALAAENGLSPADIADACDIPRSSVYRVLDADEYGWSDSVSNLSAKLQRESIRYKEVLELAAVLGYDIVWQKKREK